MGEISNDKHSTGTNFIPSPAISIQGGGRTSLNVNGKGYDTDVCFTLNATDVHGVAYIFDARGNGGGGYFMHDNRRPSEQNNRLHGNSGRDT